MGNDTEEDVQSVTNGDVSGVNRATCALTDTANSLHGVSDTHKLIGGATMLASMIQSFCPPEHRDEAVTALTTLMRSILSADLKEQPDGSFTIQMPVKQ